MTSILYSKSHHTGKLRYEIYQESKKKSQRKYYIKNKEKMLEYSHKYYQKNKEKKRLQAILQENDERRRAIEEIARFTPEERKRFDEWEVKQNVSC